MVLEQFGEGRAAIRTLRDGWHVLGRLEARGVTGTGVLALGRPILGLLSWSAVNSTRI